MKRVNLSRSDVNRRLQGNNREVSSFIESLVASNYHGISATPAGTTQYDLQGGEKSRIEVKHCLKRLSSGSKGRFRLFKKQHSALTRYNRTNTAYYVFVLIEPNERRANMKRKPPAEVGRLVGSRGGFNRSGHSSGPQHKLPWGAIF